MKLVKVVNVTRRTFNGIVFGKTVNVQEENVGFYLRNGFEVVAKIKELSEVEKKKAEKDAKAQEKKDAQAKKDAEIQAKKQADLDAEYEKNKGADLVPDLDADDTEVDVDGDDALDLDDTDADGGLDAELDVLNKDLDDKAPVVKK